MEISRFSPNYISSAAALFCANYREQRLAAPDLPDLMEDRAHIEEMLEECFDASSGVVALEDGRVTGYLAWFSEDRGRENDRAAVCIPEWGHACLVHDGTRTYQAMHRVASRIWSRLGGVSHAIAVLASDPGAARYWHAHGFGLTRVDAIRPMHPLEIAGPVDVRVRKADPGDARALALLDAEDRRRHSRSSVFKPARTERSAAEIITLLSHPRNGAWLALDKDVPVGFICCEGYDYGSAAILESDYGVMITGAYTRQTGSGRDIASALLDSALRDYQSRGYEYCAAHFESYDPEAFSFWSKYFEPVCYSLLHTPAVPPADRPLPSILQPTRQEP